MDKKTGEPILIDDKEITVSTTFTAEKSEGSVDVIFTFDASDFQSLIGNGINDHSLFLGLFDMILCILSYCGGVNLRDVYRGKGSSCTCRYHR